MKNKNQKILILNKDLIKYSKQIGIVECEIPEIVFDVVEYDRRNTEARERFGKEKSVTKANRVLGRCSRSRRMILVNINYKKAEIWKHKTIRGLKHYKKVTFGLREARAVLVHELVHYRFSYMQHGKKFEQRIKEILQGAEYPVKHITMPYTPYL